MLTLDKQTFNDIVDSLIPFNADVASRKSLAMAALFGCKVLEKLDYTGNAYDYVVRLVEKLQNYGECQAGQPALVTLLLTLKEQVGSDKQMQIEDLLTRITAQKNTVPDNGQGETNFVQPPQRRGMSLSTIRNITVSIAGIIIFFVTIFGVLPESTRTNFFMAVGLLNPTATATPTPTDVRTSTPTAAPSDTPTAIPQPTITPTNTPEPATATETSMLPTNTVTVTPAPTIIPIPASYPCEATIISQTGATILRIVYSRPDTDSLVIDEVRRNQQIIIVDSYSSSNQATWYQIAENETTIGWVQEGNVLLSNTCS